MNMRHSQMTLKYEKHEETIAVLGRAIDLLGKKDLQGALDLLIKWQVHLQHQQKPKLVDYDPREAQRQAEQR